MKRPLLLVGTVFLAIAAVFVNFSFAYAFILLGVLLTAIFVLSLIFHKKYTMLAVAAASGAAAIIICLLHINSANNFFLSSSSFSATGVITDVEKKGYFTYQLKARLVNSYGSERTMNIKLISAEEQGFEAGDTVTTKIQANLTAKQSGYEVAAFAFEPLKQYEGSIFIFDKAMVRLRRLISSSITNLLPNYQGDYVNAIIFGFDQTLEKTATINLNKSGISHITAVSGMQIAFISAAAMGILQSFKVNKRTASLVTVFFILLFAAVCGFTPSVARAVIVSLVTLIGTVFFRRSDILNSLGFAAALMTAVNPYIIESKSFQLSFITTLSIILFAPKIESVFSKLIIKNKITNHSVYYFATMLSASISVYVLLYPFLALTQGYFQPAALFANLATSSVVPIVTIFGLLASMLSFIFLPLAKPFAFVAGIGSSYIAAVADSFANVPMAVIGSQNKIILAVAIALFWCAVFAFSKKESIKSKYQFKILSAAVYILISVLTADYGGISINTPNNTGITVI
ncbi:MAG TPA: hypothetical protein DCP97_00580, partial [Ruminococcaceae bacterium]|nr:hypothetical protein [Oscillospiraceae bacterium]